MIKHNNINLIFALSVEFPTLYNLVDPKGARVVDVWDYGRGEGAWNPNLIRPINDWEVDEAQHFLSLLYDKKLYQEEKDDFSGKGIRRAYILSRLMWLFWRIIQEEQFVGI